jgi:hypothetical protein
VVTDPSVLSVTLERQCFTGAGSFTSNRVTLNVPAPVDTVLDLSSDTPTSLTAPSTVTVPSGSRSAFFAVNTLLPSLSPVLVTATLNTAPPSAASDSARVIATSQRSVADLSLSPDSVTSGSPSTGTVTLDCEAPTGGTDVALSSTGLTGVTVPSSATVPEGQLSATFQISTIGAASGNATISADSGTGGAQQKTLQVNNLGT